MPTIRLVSIRLPALFFSLFAPALLLCGQVPYSTQTNGFEKLKASAEAGDPAAQTELGAAYAGAGGVVQDYAEAVKWFRLAANQNFAGAQFRLGICYLEGWGVQKDENAAVSLLRTAADHGLAPAQASLGDCYATGTGVAKDHDEAIRWFRKAAAQGNEFAQTALKIAQSKQQVREKSLSMIITLDGRKYEHVVVLGKTPDSLMIKHTSTEGSVGVAQIQFQNLPEEWRQRYGYSRDAAVAYEASRRQALAEQQQALAQQQALRNAENLARLQMMAEVAQVMAEADARAARARAQAEAQAAQARARAQEEWEMQQLNSNLRDISEELQRLDWDVKTGRRY